MRPRIVITGMGAVCGAGRTPEAMLAAIVDGRSAIGPIRGFDITGWAVTNAAEIADFNARALVDDRKLHKLIRRTDMVGIYAGDRAAEAAGYAAYRDALDEGGGEAGRVRVGNALGHPGDAAVARHELDQGRVGRAEAAEAQTLGRDVDGLEDRFGHARIPWRNERRPARAPAFA